MPRIIVPGGPGQQPDTLPVFDRGGGRLKRSSDWTATHMWYTP
jgi:hypothetical protein